MVKTFFDLIGLDIRRTDRAKNNLEWLIPHDIKTVFDIGANTGQFAIKIHKTLPNAKPFSFEPIQECYRQLVNNTAKVENCHAFSFGLGNEKAMMPINVGTFMPSSSILPMADLHKQAFPYTADAHVSKVRIRQLDLVANDLSFD